MSAIGQKPKIGRQPTKFFQCRPHFAFNKSPPQKNVAVENEMADNKLYACVNYEDEYVQPLLISALKSRLPPGLLVLIDSTDELPTPSSNLLQWRQYESTDFEHLMQHSTTSLANSYIIRKALIRKHYLSTTVAHWIAKHPDSVLKGHVKPSVEFEVDYADFLDDALVEAWELKETWAREGEEWWILKPGMSDRGQGIRLFSSEAQLRSIFEEWDPESDDDDEDKDTESNDQTNGVMTSHLRHFIAQPYIHPPLLLPQPHPSAGRKFHIRTYVLATGALQIHVYRRMLALFASQPYNAPSTTQDLSTHLTNTCLQTGEREGSVHEFSSLPTTNSEAVFAQICSTTAQVFEAAARSMGIHFQPLPNAFELFGVDFLVDAGGRAWLLEVNAFPDFAQTGAELRGLVEGLFEGVVDVAVRPFFGLNGGEEGRGGEMVRVLDVDLGRH